MTDRRKRLALLAAILGLPEDMGNIFEVIPAELVTALTSAGLPVAVVRGLADYITESNGNLVVAINTGNGFAPPVVWHGADSDIATSQSTTLGGGAYFTIGIGPLCQNYTDFDRFDDGVRGILVFIVVLFIAFDAGIFRSFSL